MRLFSIPIASTTQQQIPIKSKTLDHWSQRHQNSWLGDLDDMHGKHYPLFNTPEIFRSLFLIEYCVSPGRFFASAEMKLLLADLLLNYDIQQVKVRPSPLWLGTNHIPPSGTVKVKRRSLWRSDTIAVEIWSRSSFILRQLTSLLFLNCHIFDFWVSGVI